MIIQNSEVKDLFEEFNTIVERAERIAIFTRDINLQKNEIQTLDEFIEKAKELNKANKKSFPEEELNLIFCLNLSAQALKNELSMIINLKEGEPNFAWGNLVEAQNLISSVARNHPFGDGNQLEGYSAKLLAFEKLLFPKMIFASTGGIVKESRCTICKLDYEECDHIKGKMYNGEICAREIHEMELEEVSLVENPANKLCRPLKVEFDGKEVDTFTLV